MHEQEVEILGSRLHAMQEHEDTKKNAGSTRYVIKDLVRFYTCPMTFVNTFAHSNNA